MCWLLDWMQVMDSVYSSSSLLCNTRKMARLAWTAFRSGGVILSTRRRQTIGECPLRAFQKAGCSVRRAGKNIVQSRSELGSVCPFTISRLSSSVTHFSVVTVKDVKLAHTRRLALLL